MHQSCQMSLPLCCYVLACADAYLTPCVQRYVQNFMAGFKNPVSNEEEKKEGEEEEEEEKEDVFVMVCPCVGGDESAVHAE